MVRVTAGGGIAVAVRKGIESEIAVVIEIGREGEDIAIIGMIVIATAITVVADTGQDQGLEIGSADEGHVQTAETEMTIIHIDEIARQIAAAVIDQTDPRTTTAGAGADWHVDKHGRRLATRIHTLYYNSLSSSSLQFIMALLPAFRKVRHIHHLHHHAGPTSEMLCPLSLARLWVILLPCESCLLPFSENILDQVSP